jgi:DNA polymerase-3 subunit epsilon
MSVNGPATGARLATIGGVLSTSVVVLDFETTGLSPRGGDRITEVAALRVRDGRVVERYVTLVNAGVRIPSFITGLTGITNAMVAAAPPAQRVVRELVDFLADDLVVAHNAGFDHGFLRAECAHAGLSDRDYRTLCTMRLARRLAPGLGSYKLSVVAEHLGVSYGGAAHRAEADAQVAADVLHTIAGRLVARHRLSTLDPELLRAVTSWPARDVPTKLTQCLRRDTPPHRAPLGAVW